MMEQLQPSTEKEALDTGLACLVMMSRLHGVATDPDQLAHEFQADGQPLGKTDILLAATKLGLQAKAVKASMARLDKTPLPALVVDKGGRFFILARVSEEYASDPRPGRGPPANHFA